MKKTFFIFVLFVNYSFLNANTDQPYNAIVPYRSLPAPSKLAAQEGAFLVLENPSDSGMFDVFNSVLGALNLYEQGLYSGLKIDLNSGRYLDLAEGTNWWEYFFEPIHFGNEEAPKHYFSLAEYMHLALIDCPQDRNRAFNLIQKYVHLKVPLREELDAFVHHHFANRFVIGVHHRGTDKILEVPVVSYEKTLRTLLQIIKKLPKPEKRVLSIFVATDDQHFLSYLQAHLPYPIIYNNFVRSIDGTALHAYQTGFYSNNYQMGKEALFDCVMLSKCNILVRPGSSGLSWISSCFNPNIPVYNLQGD